MQKQPKICAAHNTPVVIKADGLAAGKGVFPSLTVAESLAAIDRIMNQREFGEAGAKLLSRNSCRRGGIIHLLY